MLHIDPKSTVPIWSQIEEGVRQLVARELIRPGEVVPSVRQLAKDLRVNPATVSKAYRRLAESGLLEVRRGEGTFVAPEPPPLSPGHRRARLATAAQTYAGVAITLGAPSREAVEQLQEAFEEIREVTR